MDSASPRLSLGFYLRGLLTSLVAWIKLLRPDNWVKNGFVFAPLIFSFELTNLAALEKAFLAAASFSLAASGAYALNDYLDRERDSQDPEKRHRPLVSGALPPVVGPATTVTLWAAAAVLAYSVTPALIWVVGLYLVQNVLYSCALKHYTIVDVLTLSAGYVLRIVAGAVALQVVMTEWILVLTFLLALVLGFGKRRGELGRLRDNAGFTRPTLAEYSLSILDRFVTICVGATILAYSLYLTAPATTAKFGGPKLLWTLPFVVYGLFRYLYLLEGTHLGGNPTRMLLKDKPLQIAVLGWIAVAIALLYLVR